MTPLPPDHPGQRQEDGDARRLLPHAERVVEAGVIPRSELDAIDRQVGSEIEEAVAFAKAAPLPTVKDLTTDVYVNY